MIERQVEGKGGKKKEADDGERRAEEKEENVREGK